MKARSNIVLFALVAIILTIFTVVDAKCVPFLTGDEVQESLLLSGPLGSICSPILRKTYSHFWIPDDVLANGLSPIEGCQSQAEFIHDARLQALVQVFSSDEPSPLCQRMTTVAMCLQLYPPCDPTSLTYIKTPQNTPCRWFCHLFDEGSVDAVCSEDDFKYFKSFGVDLHDIAIFPEFDCTTNNWSDNSQCIVVSELPSYRPTHRCEVYTGQVCRGMFGDSYNIYVSPSQTQDNLETIAQRQLFYFNGYPGEGQCSDFMFQNLCSMLFPECIEIGATVSFTDDLGEQKSTKMVTSMQLRPSMNLCQSMHTYCDSAPIFSYIENLLGASLLPECAASSFWQNFCIPGSMGLRNYLNRYEISKLESPLFTQDSVLSSQIFASSNVNFVVDIPFPTACPDPLVLPDSDTGTHAIFDGRCHRACPSGIHTPKERDSIMLAADIASIIIMICSALLCLSFLIFKSQRHKTLMFWYTLTYFCVPFLIFLAVRIAESNFSSQCKSNTEAIHFYGWPLFQGMALIYCFLASSCWWLMQSVDLFLRLIMGRIYKRNSKQYNMRLVAMHLFCWGTPAICVSGLLTGKYIGYDGYLPFSFAAPDPTSGSKLFPLEWIFVFLPIVLCAFIGLTLISIILWFLVRYEPMHNTHAHRQQQNAAALAIGAPIEHSTIGEHHDLQQENQTASAELQKFQNKMSDSKRSTRFKIVQAIKLFGFIFIKLVFIGVYLGYSLHVASYQSQWDTDLDIFETCLVLSLDPSTCTLNSRMSPSIIILGVVSYLIPGMIMFLLYFVASSDLYRLWCGLLHYKLGLSIFSSFALEDTVGNTGSSDGSSGSSKGSSQDSSDLFNPTGEMALRKKKGKHSDTNGSTDGGNTTDGASDVENHHRSTTNNISGSGVNQLSLDTNNKSEPRRKTTLFKAMKTSDKNYGMKKIRLPSQPMSPSVDQDIMVSPSMQRDTIEMMESQNRTSATPGGMLGSPLSVTRDLGALSNGNIEIEFDEEAEYNSPQDVVFE